MILIPKHDKLPPLYAIIDAAMFKDGENALQQTIEFAQQLLQGGATFIQYRNKGAAATEIISQGRELRRVIGGRAVLIMNDRPDLCLACGFHGVHVGQEDLSVEGARRVVGSQAVVGVSTHNLPQVLEAERTSADYIAIGPVFATATKVNPEPVVGLEMVSAARNVTRKPLVAIGGITRANCRSVIAAGADSIAVISELRSSPCQSVEEFLQKLFAAN